MARNGSEQQDIPGGTAKSLAELTSGEGIEIEPVKMDMDAIELEAFMNEEVVIYVHKSREKGSLDIITPSVNGRNQPIIRGQNVAVKRKYVEALINGHEVSYEQEINQMSPDKYKMKAKPTPSYPFDVVRDTQIGRASCRERV